MRGGKLKAIAVTTEKSVPQAPTLPPVGETLPGYAAVGWFGLFAPAGTPQPLVAQINAEAVKALRHPDVEKALSDLGMEVVASSPEAFADTVRTELVKWSKVVNDSGARPDK